MRCRELLRYTGEIGEPCGPPTVVGTTCPWSWTPTLSRCLISCLILPAAIRLVTSLTSVRCGMLLKDDWQSSSTTPQARVYRSSRIATAACWASRFGLSPSEQS